MDECRHEEVVALLTSRDPVVSMVIERDRYMTVDAYAAPEELVDPRRQSRRDSIHSARPSSPTPSILR